MLKNGLYETILYKMDIFIAPIGVNTDHVKIWLQEESRNAFTLWIIHSKKPSRNPDGTINYDFPKIAKTLSKELEKSYSRIKIKFKTIDDSFTIQPILDAVNDIIASEESENPLPRQNFVINITGGTNAMAAASMNAAMEFQIRAQYVKEDKENNPDIKCTLDVPVPSKFESRLNKNQLDALKIIAESKHSIHNTPRGMDTPIIDHAITQRELLVKLDLTLRKGSNGATTLSGIVGSLTKSKYITSRKLQHYVNPKTGEKLPDDSTIDNTEKTPRIKFIKTHDEQTEAYFCDLPLDVEDKGKGNLLIITPLGLQKSKNNYLTNK
tara:strand:+ start:374 stop:1345 length:972 start_codon:yes stop_codon:yes gene_type:complete